METSEERKKFLLERLLLLQTTLPVYESENKYKCSMVKKEIDYLKNELTRSNYLSLNYLF